MIIIFYKKNNDTKNNENIDFKKLLFEYFRHNFWIMLTKGSKVKCAKAGLGQIMYELTSC